MTTRRTVLRDSAAVALGSALLGAFATGGSAAAATAFGGHTAAPAPHPDLLPDPATTPVPNPPYPHGLTAEERAHLRTFDELDFDVYSHADWDRLHLSHARTVRVHWPDGHYTDGIDRHIADLAAQFVWAPDTHISEHPLRVAQGSLTAVTGVMRGTFTRPMPDGKGGFIPPTGHTFALNMATVGLWNRNGTMDEEFLFWDSLTFNQQLGLA
ncbi:ester cyclase [Actinacidiphila guanduensis]|uniref:SnoaL-like polyketide cyclase n=1 Tax=Actinacidiphila guanduensis TaxID=310781 RepID=A0A1H0B585_9ACTN|nr:ester cyclase [Actinacidiphila guanduensis]SDN40781.1 SnoaL-like polyketide cyclase [Actinacidiphila guanduensis]